MGIQIEIDKDEIAVFCRCHHIRSFAFFGSVLRDDFGAESDVDVLVEFESGREPGLMEMVAIQSELSEILGHKADIVERRAVEASENYIRRRHVLESLEAVYVA